MLLLIWFAAQLHRADSFFRFVVTKQFVWVAKKGVWLFEIPLLVCATFPLALELPLCFKMSGFSLLPLVEGPIEEDAADTVSLPMGPSVVELPFLPS